MEAPVLKEFMTAALSSQEPWPNDVKLYQPYEVEQILLPDNASCLAVQAFLKMCNLPFEVEMRWNAEFMSPSGRVPFIRCGAFVVSELEPIVQFVTNKRVSLCSKLSTEEKAEMRAYMSLITNVLVNAELYVSWIDEATFSTVTKVRNSSVYPWPLGWLQTRTKRAIVTKRLKALHWHEKTLDQVMEDVENCCITLSQRLGDKDFFFDSMTQLDALLYGHMRALLSAKGPKSHLIIKSLTTVLLRHMLRISKIIDMDIGPQEEYLISKVNILFENNPYLSLDLDKRFINCHFGIENATGDMIYIRDFGYKPFETKQITLKQTKDGEIVCEYNEATIKKQTAKENQQIAKEITNHLLNDVDDYIGHVNDNQFEVIHNHDNDNEFENHLDLTGTSVSIESCNDEFMQLYDSGDDINDNDLNNEEIDDETINVDEQLSEIEMLRSLIKLNQSDTLMGGGLKKNTSDVKADIRSKISETESTVRLVDSIVTNICNPDLLPYPTDPNEINNLKDEDSN